MQSKYSNMKNLNELSEKELRKIIRQEVLLILKERKATIDMTKLQKSVQKMLLESINDFNYDGSKAAKIVETAFIHNTLHNNGSPIPLVEKQEIKMNKIEALAKAVEENLNRFGEQAVYDKENKNISMTIPYLFKPSEIPMPDVLQKSDPDTSA